MQVFPNLFSPHKLLVYLSSITAYCIYIQIFSFINNKLLIIPTFYAAFQSQANIFFYSVYLHVTMVSARVEK